MSTTSKSKNRNNQKGDPEAKMQQASEKVLILRTCDAGLRGYGGFQWPASGPVEAPTKWWGTGKKPAELILGWNPTIQCGGGLHGLLWGQGGAGYLNWNSGARWLVVEVAKADLLALDDKAKFPRGVVVHCGDRITATRYLAERVPAALPALIVGLSAEVGNGSTLTGGDGSTLTGGDGSTLTGGDGSTLTGGDGSTLTGGYGSTLVVRYWDDAKACYRILAAEVNADALKAGVKYRVENGKFVEAKD